MASAIHVYRSMHTVYCLIVYTWFWDKDGGIVGEGGELSLVDFLITHDGGTDTDTVDEGMVF